MPSNRSDLVLCIGYTVFWIGIQERMPRYGITFLFHDRRARPTWAFVKRDAHARFRGVGYGTLFYSRRSVER